MGQLQVDHLSKRLGSRLVIDDVSFAVEDGEFLVLLGPSGCGKSTLLRLICGLEAPDSGEIYANGVNITGLPPRERNLGMVFQDYGLYPSMDVYHNIAYGLEARGVSRAEIERRILPAAEKLGLTPLLRQPIGELSGGEQQRVALARAMVKDADAYLYDEPLSNLDPKLRHKARQDILKVHREKRKPSLYVTHDQAEAFAMGDRIAVLSNGKIQQIGTADELLSAPANTFVASFLGAPPINLLDGAISRDGDRLYFVGGGLKLMLPPKWETILSRYPNTGVVAGIRPGALSLASDGEGSIAGTVEFVELLLGESIVGLNAGQGVSLTASVADSVEAAAGDRLALAVDMEQIMLFDPDTTQAL